MKKILLILLTSIIYLVSYAQTHADSILWEKLMFAYVDTLKADIHYNKILDFNRMVGEWKLPLNDIYDKEDIEKVKSVIESFIEDSIHTEAQKEEASSVIKMLDLYETESEKMITAFRITDPQMLDNLKYCNSKTIVWSFSKMFLREWFENSSFSAFSQSKIPYLAMIANELKQMLDSLCEQETATPELLWQFLDTEYRISTSHRKEDVKK